ncbi:MAG: hypothetical protein JWR15_3037 [Prosthecobacter sp.]|nr:hypothetical protein [Prosthecobacter sp.]
MRVRQSASRVRGSNGGCGSCGEITGLPAWLLHRRRKAGSMGQAAFFMPALPVLAQAQADHACADGTPQRRLLTGSGYGSTTRRATAFTVSDFPFRRHGPRPKPMLRSWRSETSAFPATGSYFPATASSTAPSSTSQASSRASSVTVRGGQILTVWPQAPTGAKRRRPRW